MQKAPSCRYSIQVQYHLGDDWIVPWSLTELTRAFSPSGMPVSTLVVLVQDQAELMGLLNEMHGHGMRLLAVRAHPYAGTPPRTMETNDGFHA